MKNLLISFFSFFTLSAFLLWGCKTKTNPNRNQIQEKCPKCDTSKFECKMDNASIKEAVDLWTGDLPEANKKYGPINQWDTSEVTDMSRLFSGKKDFNDPIGCWNTTKVEHMVGMFFMAESFNQPIGDWKTGNVVNMNSLFGSAKAFNQDISLWDVRQVGNMGAMFSGAEEFNQNLSKWSLDNLYTADSMFNRATKFDNKGEKLDSWETALKNITCSWMFRGTKYALDYNFAENQCYQFYSKIKLYALGEWKS